MVREIHKLVSFGFARLGAMSTRTHAKSVLIDLSGTLHVEDLVIPGAIEALQRLRDAGLKIRFVTNTTKESRKCLHKRLACLGFKIDENEMFSSLTAARSYVETRKLRPYLMVAEASMEEFAGLDTSDPNAVVIGLAPDKFDFGPMNEAFRLVSKGASLIAIHKGRYYRTHSGLSLGPGPFVAALEYATDVKTKVVGKPEKGFFQSVLKLLDTRPEDAVMIGDDVRDDIDGAQKVGIRGILVETGKYLPEDEHKISPKPWAVAPSFVEAVNVILGEAEQYIGRAT
ncbi:unnamed protein product [Ixodes pacificus]